MCIKCRLNEGVLLYEHLKLSICLSAFQEVFMFTQSEGRNYYVALAAAFEIWEKKIKRVRNRCLFVYWIIRLVYSEICKFRLCMQEESHRRERLKFRKSKQN